MFRKILDLTLASMLVTMFGCSDGSIVSTNPDPESISSSTQMDVPSTADVYTFDNPNGPAIGISWLDRKNNSVDFTMETTGLDPYSIATVWIVVFNEPENCSAPACGEDDLFSPGPVVDIMHITGSQADGDGNARFRGRRIEGDNSRSLIEALDLTSPSPGLIDTQKAEIHFVVRTHGQPIAGLAGEMKQTFNAGCLSDGLPADPLIGTPGPNTCTDIQFAVHLPAH